MPVATALMAEARNRTPAAERVKVSQSWVSLHRSTDPAFRTGMEAAAAEAKARLDEAAGVRPARAGRRRAGGPGQQRAVKLGRAGAAAAVDAVRRGTVPERAARDVQRKGGVRGGGADPAIRLWPPQAMGRVRVRLGRCDQGRVRPAFNGAHRLVGRNAGRRRLRARSRDRADHGRSDDPVAMAAPAARVRHRATAGACAARATMEEVRKVVLRQIAIFWRSGRAGRRTSKADGAGHRS